MNPTELIIGFLALLSALLYGEWRFHRGKAWGWQESFFGKIEAERQRRTATGQFKQKARLRPQSQRTNSTGPCSATRAIYDILNGCGPL